MADGFYFQAEIGMRDVAVPGVQPCALPICRTRKSVMVRTTIRHVKNSHFTPACVMPYSRKAATNSNPVASSTNGYITEIGAPHARHFPPSQIQANTGTLS